MDGDEVKIRKVEIEQSPIMIENMNEVIEKPALSKYNEEWTLIWNDEFANETSLGNWNLQDWPSEKNGEWQYYSPHNVRIDNDLLIIESKREEYKRREYTSGALTTEHKFEFTYGMVEIKAKLPKGVGLFPAFWLLSSAESNWLPEIDIMENLGQHPNELYYVMHWENSNGKKMKVSSHYISDYVDFSESFHIYGLIWDETKVVWTLDGIPIFETEEFSPNTPLFLYLNTAVGGYWPGAPDPMDEYPKEMQIEYIRVYKKKEGN